jgi:hypothetical protein
MAYSYLLDVHTRSVFLLLLFEIADFLNDRLRTCLIA